MNQIFFVAFCLPNIRVFTYAIPTEIYIVKIVSEVAALFKPKFYWRYVDDTFNGRRKNVKIFYSKGSTIIIKTSSLPLKSIQLNSWHKINLWVFIMLTERQQNCQYIGQLKYRKLTNKMHFLMILAEQSEYLQISMQKLLISQTNLRKLITR